MNGKLNKNIGFSLLPFAFLFLFEPNYTVLDVLPDFIGYLIICAAIINLADIDHHVRNAFEGFRKAALISGLRYIAIYFLHTVFTDSHQTLGLLLFVFVFAVFEIIVLVPSYKNLLEGILNLGMMHDGSSMYQKKFKLYKKYDKRTQKTVTYKREQRKNHTEKYYSYTVFFVVLLRLACTLPEFTTLIANSSYEFVKLLRWFGIILVVPFGVAWLVKNFLYFSKIRKDTIFISNISKVYLEKARENSELYTYRRLSTGLYLVLVAVVLSLDFYSGFSNLIPDFMFYATLILGCVFLKEFTKKWISVTVVSSVGIVSSALAHFSAESFHSVFYPAAIRKNLQAYYAYYTMFGFHVADAVVLIITIILVLLLLWDIYKLNSEYCFAVDKKTRRQESRPYLLGAVPTALGSALAAAGNVFYVWAQPFRFYDGWYFAYSTMISVASSLILVFILTYFIGYLINTAKFRFRLYL
jgi:hypothetical protein